VGGRYKSKTWVSEPALDAPARYKKACKYQTFTPDPISDFNECLPVEDIALTAKAEKLIHELNGLHSSALAPFARLLLRSESMASSKIEGMQITPRELIRSEIKVTEGIKIGSTTREVLSNISAMNTAINLAGKAKKFTLADLLSIHKVLMQGAPNSRLAGKIRTEQNWIGGNNYNPCGAEFVPPPPDEVGALLKDLISAINGDDLPPLIQAALVHAQFETIHPFEDGNGRTGRALVQVILRKRGLSSAYVLPISIAFALEKSTYIKGLTAFRESTFAEWLNTFSTAAIQSARLAETYLEQISTCQEDFRSKVTKKFNPRSDSSIWAIIDLLPAYPVITIGMLVESIGKTKAALNQAVLQLEESKILVPISTGARNRMWESPAILTLLENLNEGVRSK
jgi:Fic family protein